MMFFMVYLLCAAWQDIRRRRLTASFLICFGLMGLAVCLIQKRDLFSTCISAGVGAGLLLLCRLSRGGVGEGDGLFFVVSGLLLTPKENIALLLSGLAFCGAYSLVLVAASFGRRTSIRKLRLPFLPFLLPGGLWLVCS